MENEYMHELIAGFSGHLEEAIKIGSSISFNGSDRSISNVLVCGLGGSGIGGTNVQKLLEKRLKVPFTTNKGYHIPEFINENSLVICCSYSGNTEETLAMYEQARSKKAELAVICSGGKFEQIAKNEDLNHIVIPGGLPPRAAFGLAFPQLFFCLNKYDLIDEQFISEFQTAINLINSDEDAIRAQAKEIAKFLENKLPILYAEDRWEGVLVRLRQQINENAKMLCWHHVFPELNHNELVGWTNEDHELAVLLLRDEADYYRNKERFDFTKKVIGNYTPNIKEIWAKGSSMLEKAVYFIHFGDWISYYLAELKDIDSVEVNVISGLKDMLADLK